MKFALIVMIFGLVLIMASKVYAIVKKEKLVYSICVIATSVIGIVVAIMFLAGVSVHDTVILTVLCAIFVALGFLYFVCEIVFIIKDYKQLKQNEASKVEASSTDNVETKNDNTNIDIK